MKIEHFNRIHQNHINQKFYTIDEKDRIRSQSLNRCEEPLKTVNKLLEYAEQTTTTDEEKRILVSCANDYLNWIKDASDEVNTLRAKVFLLLMGKNPEKTKISSLKEEIENKSEWFQFIQVNKIHYLVHGERISFADEVTNKINIDGNWINWDALTKEKIEGGYQLLYNGKVAFKTDQKLNLNGYFYAGEKGIIRGSPTDIHDIGDFFQRTPSGKHWMSVYVSSKDPMQVLPGESHTYIGLEDEKGKLLYAGQYGIAKELSTSDYLTICGETKMGIESPNRYAGMPLARHHLQEAKIEITKEQYDLLIRSLKKDIRKGVRGGPLVGNCAKFVGDKLKLIGIEAKIGLSSQDFLFRALLNPLPRSINQRVYRWIKDLPPLVQKVAHFNPFLYPVSILGSLILRGLSGFRSEVSILKCIFTPWRVELSHPIAIKEWLSTLEKEQQNYTIKKADCEETTEVGKEVNVLSSSIGLKKGTEGKIHLRDSKHITQHKVKPILIMLIEMLFIAVIKEVKRWFTHKDSLNNQESLTLLHTLMNQKYINPYQFYSLRDCMDSRRDFKHEIALVVQSLHKNQQIDHRSFIHLNQMLRKGLTNDVLKYIIGLSMISSLNHTSHNETIKELMTPGVQIEINAHLKKQERDFYFSNEAIQSIHHFSSRVNCYEWAKLIPDRDVKNELLQAIKTKNEALFKEVLTHYFHNLTQQESNSFIEKKIAEEMLRAIKFPYSGNLFTDFANVLTSQARIAEIMNGMDKLKQQIAVDKDTMNEETLKGVRELHQNLGIFLDAQIGFTGSATFLSTTMGELRGKWEEVDLLLDGKVIPKNKETDLWPDIGYREIQQILSAEEYQSSKVDKKKVFFAFCSWGNGHKNATNALTKALGADYRVSCCDLPDEVLIGRDPVARLFGKKHSVTNLYNTLTSGNYMTAISLFRGDGKGKRAPDVEREIQKELVRNKILREKPDMVVAVYEAHSDILLEVARELGLPFVQVYTDMTKRINNHLRVEWKNADDYRHKKILSPYPIKEMKDNFQDAGVKKDEYRFIGYAVREEFLVEMNKKELRKKWNVKENQKVVLCVNGGAGGEFPYPEVIAKAKKGSLPPMKLIVVCGKNEKFKKEVEQLKISDPNIEIEVLGFTQAKEMAEICEIASVAVTKPGGSTVAENLIKKNFMLLDPQSMIGLKWEKAAAEKLSQEGLAAIIKSQRAFTKQLAEALKVELPESKELHQQDGKFDHEFQKVVKEMLIQAEHDPTLSSEKKEFKPTYPLMNLTEPNKKHFQQNLAQFLLLNEEINPERIIPSLKRTVKDAREQGKFIRFDVSKSRFKLTNKIYEQDLEYAVDVVHREAKKCRLPLETLKDITAIVTEARKKKKEVLHQIPKKLASIDFHRVSKYFRDQGSSPTLEEIQKEFVSGVGGAQELNYWMTFLTSRGRAKPDKYPSDVMLSQEDAVDVFIHNPKELECIRQLHLHKSASAFNHKFKAQDHHLYMMRDGAMQSVADIVDRFKSVNGSVISIDSEAEYVYTHNMGLCKIDPATDPVHWEDDLPLFKVKSDRKTQDYRLELMSVRGAENHGWVRLKDPTGNVYSFGTFWDPDYGSFRGMRKFYSLPGYVRGGGDLQEFLGQEPFWKRTKITLDEKMFNQIKTKAEKYQRENHSYNLANGSCLAFVSKIINDDLKVKFPIKEMPFIAYCMNESKRKYLLTHSKIRKVVDVVAYPLILLQNLLLSALGMWDRKDVELEEGMGFTKFGDIFSPESGKIYTPQQLVLVQKVLEETYGSDKIDYKQFLSAKKTESATLCYRAKMGCK